MPEILSQPTISILKRQEMIQFFPCFANLTDAQAKEMASHMQEVRYQPQEKIVVENDLVDSIYVIVSGEAEVTREEKKKKKIIQVPIAALRAGEGVGLNDTGFYSTTGKRTATVTALTEMILLYLDLKDLYAFLQKNNLELSMYAASLQMLRMRFIKQSLPFTQLSHDRLQWLAQHVEEIRLPAGAIIFKQGEPGDKCYLIHSGKVEIVHHDGNQHEKQLATLKPPTLFGEATLITHAPRNATARTMEDTELLVLNHAYLSELLETEENVASMFMTLMVDRSRPKQNSHVSLHQRNTADGYELTILKNPDNGNYFKLSEQGGYIWQQMDGQHTLQEITLSFADEFNVFAPDVVVALISKLTRGGFVENVEQHDAAKYLPTWRRRLNFFVALLDKQITFGDSDKWLTRMYNNYIHYLFTRPAQLFFMLLAIIGVISFVMSTPSILHFFHHNHFGLLLILGLIPLSLLKVILHELGHAFAVKYYGYEVHYMGVALSMYGTPVAFTDTSDMWLAPRKPRMIVNMAGIFVDMISAGISAILIFCIPNHYIQGMLWLFALYTYLGGFHHLNPTTDMDGYYALMDWLEKNRLRHLAVTWLVRKFPKAIRHPRLLKENYPERMYWLACILYLVSVTVLTYIVQNFILKVIGMETANLVLKLIVPFFAVIFTSFSILGEIRQAEKEKSSKGMI
jgi:putative peptide zinc metalloprotease protein